MLVPLDIVSFGLEPGKHAPMVVLRERGGDRTLCLPVSPVEASAIAMNSLGVAVDKPLTIDLVRMVLDAFGGTLERVLVGESGGASLRVRLQLAGPQGVLLLDCSASSAVALALRCDAPLFAFESALAAGDGKPPAVQELRQRVQALHVLDFGRCYPE